MVRRWAITAVIVLAAVFGAAVTAQAMPGHPTLGIEALQAKLDAAPGGTLTGYFKTVVSGSTIETIPVEILAIATDPLSDPMILFEASGPRIDRFGGIAQGMSGSPIYVSDEGVDKIVGAVAHGDTFTLGGMGVATGIESMLDLMDEEERGEPTAISLDEPVKAGGRVIERILIPHGDIPEDVPAGTLVARPLSAVFIGGLRSGNRVYARLERALKAQGASIVPLAAPLTNGALPFSTLLEPGASVGAFDSMGDFLAGGMGTVTYDSGDSVLAFGHEYRNDGPTGLFMTNVWVHGIWPSDEFPYKIGQPGAVRGAFVNDGLSGAMGTIGAAPESALVTAFVRDADTGREATASSSIASFSMDRGYSTYYAPAAASIAGYRLSDWRMFPGSAHTTTTIVLTDGADEYTVHIADAIDDADDVISAMTVDIARSLDDLIKIRSGGFENPHIVSVDLQAEISKTRKAAKVVGVQCPDALRIGDNRVIISLVAHGVADTQTIETTLVIPAGTSLSGSITAAGSDPWDGFDWEDPFDELDAPILRPGALAAAVKTLNGSVPGNEILVWYTPSDQPSFDDDDVWFMPSSEASTEAIETTLAVPWVVTGGESVVSANMTAFVGPQPVPYGGMAIVRGTITGASREATTVYVYGTPAGETTEQLLATGTITYDKDEEETTYFALLTGLHKNTALRIHIPGENSLTPLDSFTEVKVRALVGLSPRYRSIRYGQRVTLSATVYPSEATGTVRFEYYNGSRRRWVAIGSRALRLGQGIVPTKAASMSWRPPKGTVKVRAFYFGGTTNVASVSAASTLKVRR